MSGPALTDNRIRQRLFVEGVVQGVGFRPCVYGLALRHHLSGFVGNNSEGVFIEIEGAAATLAAFVRDLRNNPPPLAHIEQITITEMDPSHENGFEIVQSQAQYGANTLISPDLCICDDCLQELQNPADRRYRYPFINCTNCGPRFTIIKDIPYDRLLTTMAAFPMCEACEAEYYDPLNRRFHAQPNACPDCGPQVNYIQGQQQMWRDDAIGHALEALHRGQVVAVKGLGGFHLACDASNDDAVNTLRDRKGRQGKPFAVMVRDVATARQIATVSDAEARILTSRERPIVLLHKRDNTLSENVTSGNPYVGVMLPYTPLHYLLVERPLVMTSANYSNEPIVKDNDEALAKLSDIADGFLLHDRDIHVHCDDSVIRVLDEVEYPVRRSRGYAPFPVKLPFNVSQVLAVGGELKSTFCLAKGDYAFMSQHIGDMENLETLRAFERAYQHMSTIFRVEPKTIVCDQHPRYLSTQWATRFAAEQDIPLVKVQHHHAHIAGVMAENGVTGPVIGFSYDGTGYGDDGAIWGGEVIIADYMQYERVSHLPYMPLPGGDAAIKNPYRLALAYLWANGITWDDMLPPIMHATSTEKRVLRQQLERNVNVAQTSSMGRLFDVVAALIGVRQEVSYEAQAAIELEALATVTDQIYPFSSIKVLLTAIVGDLQIGRPVSCIAGKFHNTVAHHILQISQQIRERQGLNTVALSGGVFQNVTLLQQVRGLLNNHQFNILVHQQVPANDGGLALGQAVIASQLI